MNSNIDMNNFDLKVKPPVNNSDLVTLEYTKNIIHTIIAYYERDESPYIQYAHKSPLVLPFDINWISLELIIFGNNPGRIGIETKINNDIYYNDLIPKL